MKPMRKSGALLLCGLMVTGAASGGFAQQPDSYAVQDVQSARQSPKELQQLIAPIALYPDALVGQILAASVYPSQIVEANRWMQEHTDLKGEELAQEVNKQPWDPSVRALTQFPDVLANLDKNLSWTSALGDAYVNQPQAVLDAVQTMRKRARSSGNLKTTPQEKVITQGDTIIIEPASPEIVYVPTYDPWQVYGAPIPVYPGWSSYGGLYVSRPGISFGIGFGVGLFAGFGWGWNHWGADWHRHTVIYNHNHYNVHNSTFVRRNTYNHFDGRNRYNSTLRNGSNFRPGGATGYRAPGYTQPHFTSGSRPGAFGGFNHGGVVQGYSARGHASLGGTPRPGGSIGSGFHGAAPRSGGGGDSHGSAGGFHGGGASHGGSPGGSGGTRGGGGGRQ